MKSLIDAFSVCCCYFSLFPWFEGKRLILEISTTYSLPLPYSEDDQRSFLLISYNAGKTAVMLAVEHIEWKQINMTAPSRRNEQSYR